VFEKPRAVLPTWKRRSLSGVITAMPGRVTKKA
jgi:hypothetical protein